MNPIILLGEPEDRRTAYFLKAAERLNVPVQVLPYSTDPQKLEHHIVKLDPPVYDTDDVGLLSFRVKSYLEQLEQLSKQQNILFMNTPTAIKTALNKKETKNILLQKGIPTIPTIKLEQRNLRCLREQLRAQRAPGLFLKPNLGSGAAGIMVYRYNFATDQQVLYTTVLGRKGVFHNTKKVHRLTDYSMVKYLLDWSLRQKPLIEPWMPKYRYGEYLCDFRVVVVFDKVIYKLARASKSPITNLHLNNHPVTMEALDLPTKTLAAIDELAIAAAGAIPGLSTAGLDILLTPKLVPYVIEINGQGDLIHNDIYHDNEIYTSQIKGMVERYAT